MDDAGFTVFSSPRKGSVTLPGYSYNMAEIPIRTGKGILDEIEKVYDDITRRAYDYFLERRGSYTLDIEDWLAAEKQLLWKPAVELIQKDDVFVVRLDLNGANPATIDVLATADDLLIQSAADSAGRRLFRTVHFPAPVNPQQVHAANVGDALVVIAQRAAARTAARLPAPSASRELRIAD